MGGAMSRNKGGLKNPEQRSKTAPQRKVSAGNIHRNNGETRTKTPEPKRIKTPVPTSFPLLALEDVINDEAKTRIYDVPVYSKTLGIYEVPHRPKTPRISEVPERPKTPSIDEVPDRPNTPSISEVPERPKVPKIDAVPDRPKTLRLTVSDPGMSTSTTDIGMGKKLEPRLYVSVAKHDDEPEEKSDTGSSEYGSGSEESEAEVKVKPKPIPDDDNGNPNVNAKSSKLSLLINIPRRKTVAKKPIQKQSPPPVKAKAVRKLPTKVQLPKLKMAPSPAKPPFVVDIEPPPQKVKQYKLLEVCFQTKVVPHCEDENDKVQLPASRKKPQSTRPKWTPNTSRPSSKESKPALVVGCSHRPQKVKQYKLLEVSFQTNNVASPHCEDENDNCDQNSLNKWLDLSSCPSDEGSGTDFKKNEWNADTKMGRKICKFRPRPIRQQEGCTANSTATTISTATTNTTTTTADDHCQLQKCVSWCQSKESFVLLSPGRNFRRRSAHSDNSHSSYPGNSSGVCNYYGFPH